MKSAVVLFLLASTATSAWALDVSRLPDSCKTVVDGSKADKPQYSELSGVMTKARKAKDNAAFCAAAKNMISLISGESDRVDQCLGELAGDKTVTPDTVGQFTEIRTYYHKFLAASKDPANDHMHCGLAN